MSIDYSLSKFSIGDKVENRLTFQTGRVEKIETGIRAADDRFFVNGEWYRANDLILIK